MNLTNQESHFAFGKNWRSFAESVGEREVEEAIKGLQRLFPEGLKGKTFLDIGCGSGLSMVAASRLGAAELMGADIDRDSVATAKALLDRFGIQADVNHCSVFDLPENQYDVVYSWGVLHHTGDMWRAIEKASRFVKPNGVFALALYRKTSLCSFWKIEKRLYSTSPPWIQKPLTTLYMMLYGSARSLLPGKKEIIRGMDMRHDVHDWLGGYPYESTTREELENFLDKLGFRIDIFNPSSVGTSRLRRLGLFGSGCDEYVAKPAVHESRLS